MMLKILFFCLIFCVNSYSASVSINLPEININEEIVVTGSNNLNPFSPCTGLPTVIDCTDDSFNLEVTLKYPITVTISNIGVSQILDFSISTNPVILKEFKSFSIKRNGSTVTFPESISSNQTIVYDVEMVLDYFGFESLSEYRQLFNYSIDTN